MFKDVSTLIVCLLWSESVDEFLNLERFPFGSSLFLGVIK